MANVKLNIAQVVMGSIAEHFFYLAERWKNEKEYEDWNDYIESMKKKVDEIDGATFVSMKKRPFSFEWQGKDGKTRITRLHKDHMETIQEM